MFSSCCCCCGDNNNTVDSMSVTTYDDTQTNDDQQKKLIKKALALCKQKQKLIKTTIKTLEKENLRIKENKRKNRTHDQETQLLHSNENKIRHYNAVLTLLKTFEENKNDDYVTQIQSNRRPPRSPLTQIAKIEKQIDEILK